MKLLMVNNYEILTSMGQLAYCSVKQTLEMRHDSRADLSVMFVHNSRTPVIF